MADYICSECGYVGKCKITKSGSLATELKMWLLYVIPGPIYTLWRLRSRKRLCRHCDSEKILSIKTETGYALLKKQENELLESIRSGGIKPTQTEES